MDNVIKIDGRKNRSAKEYYFYNKEVKDQFLDFIKETQKVTTWKLYYKQLSKLSEYERDEWQDDVFNVTNKEIDDFLDYIETSSIQTKDVFRTIIKRYIQWSITQGYSKSNFDFTQMINSTGSKKHINTNAAKVQYIWSQDELYKICNFCANAQDAICFVLPYFSIDGISHEEILNLTQKDIKENGVIARKDNGEERFVEIPERFLEVIRDAAEEQTYYKNNNMCTADTKFTSFEMQPSQYVIKIANKMQDWHMTDAKINPQIVNQRIKKILLLYDDRNIKRLNPKNLFLSGLFDYFRTKEDEQGAELSREQYLEGLRRYNIPETLISMYKEKYKLFKQAYLEEKKRLEEEQKDRN
jgi:site-specific recombinase XerD